MNIKKIIDKTEKLSIIVFLAIGNCLSRNDKYYLNLTALYYSSNEF